MHVQKITVGILHENTYILSIGNDCIVIDPGSDAPTDLARITEAIGEKNVLALLCTHNHFDHIGALHCFPDTPIFMHSLDLLSLELATLRAKQFFGIDITLPTQKIQELGSRHEFADFALEVLHTPGHSAGSVCFWFKEHDILMSGDTLFKGTYGRTDLPGSSPAAMVESLHRLAKLPDTTHIYPGHGWDGELKEEKEWITRL